MDKDELFYWLAVLLLEHRAGLSQSAALFPVVYWYKNVCRYTAYDYILEKRR